MAEHSTQNTIRNDLAGQLLLFRANVGQGWQGDVNRLPDGSILIRNPRPFNTGLPPGFSDLFGLAPVVITPEMVGMTLGVFVGGECKAPLKGPTEKQQNFLKAVNDNGGVADVWRSSDDARATLARIGRRRWYD